MKKTPKEPPTLDDRISWLDAEKARFILRVLMLSGHLTDETMVNALNLTDGLNWDAQHD